MPKDMSADTRIEAVAGKSVELPNGNFVANAEMTRAGMDLHLTGPDGHTIIVEGYFAQMPAPDLVTHDGARLTPAMVNAFVPPEHVGQYAASGQIANDASPAGKITQVVGEAHIIHADGTKTLATVGALIFQGDVVETSKTGAVNIQFADNTTFAISESARMSVDQFVYHAADHSGSTFFSMLQGVFVYTSGLIGKTDPGSVNIETPVGSIGIRGTVVAGHILPAGQNSQITIVDGAVTLTNGSGTQELNTSLATVSLNGYQAQPETVQMDAHTFNSSYHSVSSVASESLNHFTGMTAPAPVTEHAPANAPAAGSGSEAAPAAATPAPAAHAPAAAPAVPAPAAPVAPTGSAAPAPSSTDSTTQAAANTAPATTTTTAAAPPAPTVTDVPTAAPPPPASTTSTFSNGPATSGASDTASSAGTFAAPPAAGNTAGTSSAASTTTAPTSTETTSAPATGTTTTNTPPAGTGTTTTAPTPIQLAVSAALASATTAFSAANAATANAATAHADALAAAGSATTAQAAATAAAANSTTDPTDAAAAQSAATAAIALNTAAHNADVDATAQATAAHNAATAANSAYQAALAATDAPTAQSAAAMAATYATSAQASATAASADLTNAAAATTSAATDATQAQASQGLVAAAVSTALSAEVSAAQASVTAAHTADIAATTNAATAHADALAAAASATAAQTAATTAAANSATDPTDATAAQTAATAAANAVTAANAADTAAAAQVTAANTAYANAQAALTATQAETNPVTAQTDVTNASNAYLAANTAANAVSVDLANALAAMGTASNSQTAAQTSEGLVATAVALAAAVTTATTAVAAASAAVANATTYANNASTYDATTSTDAGTVNNAYTTANTPGSGAFASDVANLLTVNTSAQNTLTNANAMTANAGAQLSAAQTAYTAAQTALTNAETAQTAGNLATAQAAATAATGDATTASNSAAAAQAAMTQASNDVSAAASDVTAATAFRLDNIFSTTYTNNTPGTTLDDGVKEFAVAGTVISQITSLNSGADAITYTVTVLGNNSPQEILTGASLSSLTGATNAFSINSSGQLVVNNPLALDGYFNQSGITLQITAHDSVSNATINEQLLVQIHNEPSLNLFGTEVQGPPPVRTTDYTGSTADQFILGGGTTGLTLSDGGFAEDVILGNNYGDTIVVSNNAFQYINGGAGVNTLELATTAPQMWDFTNPASIPGTVTNFQDISLATPGSSITLDNQNLAGITGETSTPMLVVDTSQGSIVINNTLGTSNMAYSMSLFDGQDGVIGGRTVPGPGFGLLFSDAAGDNLVVAPDATGNNGTWASGTGVGARVQVPLTGLAANDQAGGNVAISGNEVIVGAAYHTPGAVTNSGSVYIENIATGTMTQINDPMLSLNDHFGSGVAIAGNYAVVGADGTNTNAGAAYIFNATTGTEVAALNTSSLAFTGEDNFGDNGVATDGTTIVVGATGAAISTGDAYVFNMTGNYLYTLTNPDPITGGDFGFSTAVSGSTIVVGEPGTIGVSAGGGAAYLYSNGSSTGIALSDPGATAAPYGLFGDSVATNGSIIVVGAPDQNSNGATGDGTVYVYSASGSLLTTIVDPNHTAGDNFGFSVGVSGNEIVVGSPVSGNGGHTYVYDFNGTTATLAATLADPGGIDSFGMSTGISGSTVVVGAPLGTGSTSNSGTAYTYTNATTGAQVTVEGANAGYYTAFQASDFAGLHSVVGTLGPAADSYLILSGDSAHNLISAGGFTTTESTGTTSTPFAIVGNQIVVNDPTALFADQAFTLNVENMTTTAITTVAIFSSDPFSPGVFAQGELMDTTSGGQTVTATTNNQIVWGGQGTTGDTLSDGGAGAFNGDALIGSNAGNNTIDVSNSNFALVDGGTGANNYLGLMNTSTSTPFDIDFETLSSSVKNISTINLGYSAFGGISNGNSVTLNVQDVFDMTNAANNHTLNIIQGNGVSNSAVNVAMTNANAALDFTQTATQNYSTGAPAVFQGNYNNTHVTLVIYDAAASGSNHIAVHAVA